MKPMVRILLLMSLLSLFGCGKGQPASPPPAKGAQLTWLHINSTNGYHAHSNTGYTAERLGDGKARISVEVGNDRDRVFDVEEAVMDTLETIVNQYKMYTYSGYYQPNVDVLDGDSWSLELDFSDGSYSSCGGYMAFPPKDGSTALGKVQAFLSRWLYQEPAEEVALVAYHYEYHDAQGSEIYDFKQDGKARTAFVRLYGQDKGFTYQGVGKDLTTWLGYVISWNHMASYTGENLAEEDTSRPRWILKAEYENGQKIEAMDYLDRGTEEGDWRHTVPSMSEMELRNETELRFSEEIQRITAEQGNK